MTRSRLATAAWLTLLSSAVVLAQIPQPFAPQPPQPGQPVPGQPDGVEVLARGPVHEAFAGTAEVPVAAEIVAKVPPDPIEELPPDQKPPGDNVQWIPGYWHWDEERTDFIWISGFWRQPPPGRVWIPGSWRAVNGGSQWVQGFWSPVTPQQQQPAQIEYLPQPPAPVDIAPSIPAPTVTSFYTPGVWQWRGNRYAWRPGFWAEIRPNWVWVPAHYRWTPAGYIFIDGYWDLPLAERGVLFAPVVFRPAVIVQPRFVYTPSFIITDTSLYGSLFIRHGYGSYYFGDYYEARYTKAGYSAWCSVSLKLGNFAVGVGRPVAVYDPLWSYYSVAYRHEPKWQTHVSELYVGRYNGDFARPPHTLVQQNIFIKNVGQEVHGNVMLTKISDFKPANRSLALVAVPQAERVREQKAAQEIRQVSVQRQKLETNLVDRGRAVIKTTDTPQSLKFDIPKTTVVRAHTLTSGTIPDAPKPATLPPKVIPPANPHEIPKVGNPPPKGNPPGTNPGTQNPITLPPKGNPPGTNTGTNPGTLPPKGNPPGTLPPKGNPPGTNPGTNPVILPPKGNPPGTNPGTNPGTQTPITLPPKGNPPGTQNPSLLPPHGNPPGTIPGAQTPGTLPPHGNPPGPHNPGTLPPKGNPPAQQLVAPVLPTPLKVDPKRGPPPKDPEKKK